MKRALIGAGFSLLGGLGLHRLAPPAVRGLGAILMFHHVRPQPAEAFRPNALLEITPAFLEAVILRLRQRGHDIVTLDEALVRCRAGRAVPGRPFAVLTFDDGYRDNLEHALPVLARHDVPFTVYITPGFAEGTAGLWWKELEEAIRRRPDLRVAVGAETLTFGTKTARDKQAAFDAIYTRLRQGSEAQLVSVARALRESADVDGRALTAALCMNWEEVVGLSRRPGATIGAHTMTHPRLAKIEAGRMIDELDQSRAAIEARIGRTVSHFSYPVGDPTSAGRREFEAARHLGFASAVTTRPGLVFPEHADHLTALPRLSVNGNWQTLVNIEVLLSGAAFALWNRGRRVNAA